MIYTTDQVQRSLKRLSRLRAELAALREQHFDRASLVQRAKLLREIEQLEGALQ